MIMNGHCVLMDQQTDANYQLQCHHMYMSSSCTEKAYYGSEQHKDHLKGQIAEAKEKVDPEFKVIAIQTDNERTMRSLRNKFKEVCVQMPSCTNTNAIFY